MQPVHRFIGCSNLTVLLWNHFSTDNSLMPFIKNTVKSNDDSPMLPIDNILSLVVKTYPYHLIHLHYKLYIPIGTFASSHITLEMAKPVISENTGWVIGLFAPNSTSNASYAHVHPCSITGKTFHITALIPSLGQLLV